MNWLGPLLGAFSTAAIGLLGLLIRRAVYGHAEDEQLATKAAHQAVEAVEDAISTLRQERTENRAEIEQLQQRDREKGRRISELEATVNELRAHITGLEHGIASKIGPIDHTEPIGPKG